MRGEGNKIIEDLKKPAKPMTEQDMMDMALNFGPMAVGSIGTKVTPSLIAKVRDRLLNEKQGGDQLVRRLDRAADEVPNLEDQFNERALFDLFGRVNAGWEGNRPNLIKVINPSEFSSKYAAELPTMGRKQIMSKTDVGDGLKLTGEDLSNTDYVNYLANEVLKNQGGFDRVPSLSLEYRNPETHIIKPHGTPQLYIPGHEGRHRTAALDKAGFDKTLVEFDPSRDLRNLLIENVKSEPPVYIDRLNTEGYRGFYDQDRFLNNFKKLFGESPKIAPELEERSPVFFKDFFAGGGSTTQTHPKQGGLAATNYPNPYGLRSWQDEQGNYQGQMMPKTSGWQGEIPTLTGDVMTEQSLGGNTSDEPFYPMITQNMSPEMIKTAQEFEVGLLDPDHPDVQALMKHAREEAMRLMRQGKSPFKDYN